MNDAKGGKRAVFISLYLVELETGAIIMFLT